MDQIAPNTTALGVLLGCLVIAHLPGEGPRAPPDRSLLGDH
jgi:hypothetical protein